MLHWYVVIAALLCVLITGIIFLPYIHQSDEPTEGIPEGFFDDPRLDAKVWKSCLLGK